MDDAQFKAEVMRSLGALEAGQTALQTQLAAHDQRVVSLTGRVVSLEKWQARVVGIVVGIAAIVGVVANWIGKKLGL
jgi:hypothetical protein